LSQKQTNYPHPERYSYCDVVTGLVWSDDLESYAGGSVATGRTSLAREVKGDGLTKRDTPDLEVRGWAWG